MDADASMCRDGSLPSVPPASLPRITDNAAACGCRIVTSGRCVARPAALPLRIAFCIVFTFFKVDWSIIGVCGDVDRKDGDADAGSSYPVHQSHWTPVASCSLCPGAVLQA